jgi:DNA polymerase III gamma/tau subunit
MSDLFRKPLVEKYRPATWNDVVGQDKFVSRIHQLAERNALT